MNESRRRAFLAQVEAEPYARKLGLRLVDVQEGYARVEMDLTPDMTNILGTIHGGAIFSLVDEAFQVASNSHGTVAMALNMSISFLAAPAPEIRLTAEATEFHRTRKTAHYEIRVTDDQGKLIATCNALVYRKSEPIPFLEQPP